MEKDLEDMDITNPSVKDLHQEVMGSVKVSLHVEYLHGKQSKLSFTFCVEDVCK